MLCSCKDNQQKVVAAWFLTNALQLAGDWIQLQLQRLYRISKYLTNNYHFNLLVSNRCIFTARNEPL